jgi:hypothetical protein
MLNGKQLHSLLSSKGKRIDFAAPRPSELASFLRSQMSPVPDTKLGTTTGEHYLLVSNVQASPLKQVIMHWASTSHQAGYLSLRMVPCQNSGRYAICKKERSSDRALNDPPIGARMMKRGMTALLGEEREGDGCDRHR